MANGTNGNGQNGGTTRWSLIGATIVVVIAVALFFSLRPRRIRITVAQPVRTDITTNITTNGRVEPVQNFEAHAPNQTTVRRILVHEGQKVKKGELLVQLDDANARAELARSEAALKNAQVGATAVQQGGTPQEVLTRQADLSKARAELDAANRNLEAVQRLQQKGAASQEEVSAAQQRVQKAQTDVQLLSQKPTNAQQQSRAAADVAQAQAAVDAARQMIADANVRAPFDATVYSIPVRLGSWVNPGDLLVQVANLDTMQVRTYVDEPEIGKLSPGQPARITWDAMPGKAWAGSVKTIPTTVVQHGNRNVGEVLTAVDNSDRKLIPNTNVSVVITTNSRPNALVVPREAMREDDGKPVLFVVKDDHLRRTPVDTGVASLTQIEILKGISDSDVIAVQSLSPTQLTDGITVKIVDNPQ